MTSVVASVSLSVESSLVTSPSVVVVVVVVEVSVGSGPVVVVSLGSGSVVLGSRVVVSVALESVVVDDVVRGPEPIVVASPLDDDVAGEVMAVVSPVVSLPESLSSVATPE